MTRITVTGKRLDRADEALPQSGFIPEGLELCERISTAQTRREPAEKLTLHARESDVLELHCEGGLIELLTVAQARERAVIARGAQADEFELQTVFDVPVSRGDARRFVEEVRQFDVTALHQRIKASYLQQAAELTAEVIATAIEREFWNKRPVGLGLRQVDHRADAVVLLPESLSKATSAKAPYLLFLHGTFSNTVDGFKGFANTQEWQDLRKVYANRILAFEHKTLALSPLDNALTLVEQLPEGAELDLITHSRGGLVGDLLNLPVVERAVLEQMSQLRREKRPQAKLADLVQPSHEQFAKTEAEKLTALSNRLQAKRLRVRRYLRAASPARGTVLASRRLDIIAKLILNVVGLTPGLLGNPLYGFVKALALATLNIKTDPRTLPGLEAMMPDSPFIWLLNQLPVSSEDKLAVIAGDIEGSGIFGRLKVLATDLLYGFVDHDLVVNTDSMYQGLRRAQAYAAFQQGPQIAHTAYFANEVARARVRNYLLWDEKKTELALGFSALPPGATWVAPDNTTRDGAPPTQHIILVRAQLAGSWRSAQPTAADSRLPALLSRLGGDRDLYRPLLDELAKHAAISQLDYDLTKSPAQLAEELEQLLTTAQRAGATKISVIAHSGGALVVVAMLHKDQSLRDKLDKVILLGPPLDGSFEALRWVHGQGALVQQLELIAVDQTSAELGQQLSELAGVRALLPPLAALNGMDLPRYAELARDVASLRRPIEEAQRNNVLRRVHCVLGRIPALTANRPQPSAAPNPEGDEPALAWSGSSGGDGFVLPLAVNRLGGAKGWLAPTDQAGLITEPVVRTAICELLHRDQTYRLTTLPTQLPREQLQTISSAPQLFPNAESIVRAAIGAGSATSSRRPNDVALEVEVVNGSLDTCQGPVAIGHYTGAPIGGASTFLDRMLDGALRNHQYLGLYPELPGQAQLIGRGPDRRLFAMVLGLGPNGELTPDRLTTAVAEGALRFAMAEAQDQPRGKAPKDQSKRLVGLTLNSLLIGTIGRQGLSIPSAVAAIVRGVLRANRALSQRDGDELSVTDDWGVRVQITKLSFVERYQDLAEEAAEAVCSIDKLLSSELSNGMRLQPKQYLTEGRGCRPGRPKQDYEQGSWQPLIIDMARGPAAASDGRADIPLGAAHSEPALSFTYLGRLARTDESDAIVATRQVLRLIEQTVTRHDVGQINNTIYELLIPQELKDDVASATNLQLVVDGKTASIPWELMATRDHRGQLRPLSTRVGVLRRLKLDSNGRRHRGRAPMAMDALVVGDPYAGPNYPQLQGARDEARLVEQLLAGARYSVRTSIGRDDNMAWQDILDAVFERGYRIMHIAAHGQYRSDNPGESGVVIGQDEFLTASTVKQLPVVPELVFLNCCHLGRTGDGLGTSSNADNPSDVSKHLNEFAASIAASLMQIGVRAVIAAGWAVEDRSACAFARTFYEEMLSGHALGDSVTRARQAAYDENGASNTWGAYQCYGDPAFRLSRSSASEGARPRIVGRAGFNRALENLIEDVADARREPELAPLQTELQCLEREAPPQWLTSSDTRHLLGRAYSELGDFAEAVRHYTVALNSNAANWPAVLVEQLANIELRWAVARVHASGQSLTAREEIVALFDRVLARLRAILALGETAERLALFGSYYKKRATTQSDIEQVRSDLQQSKEYYRKAWQAKCGVDDSYEGANYLQMSLLLDEPLDEERQRLLATAADEAKQANERGSSFWDHTALPDLGLTQLLSNATKTQPPASFQSFDELAAAYEQVMARQTRSTLRERRSVTEHLCELDLLCGRLGRTAEQQGLERVLKVLELTGYPRPQGLRMVDPSELGQPPQSPAKPA